MDPDARVELVNRFFSGTGPTYDLMVNLCTFGMDHLWKKSILNRIPENPVRIMDLACGTGILTFEIARKFPASHVIGVELRDEYLDIARRKARQMGMENVEFILSRAEDVLLDKSLDCVTSSYLAKYADLKVLIRNTREMLRSGGILLMHDFTSPKNQAFARVWKAYFTLLRALGRSLVPQWGTIYNELPDLIRKTRWATELLELLEENNFTDVSIEFLTLGTSAIVSARR